MFRFWDPEPDFSGQNIWSPIVKFFGDQAYLLTYGCKYPDINLISIVLLYAQSQNIYFLSLSQYLCTYLYTVYV